MLCIDRTSLRYAFISMYSQYFRFCSEIQHRTLSVPSLQSASDYYDNMTAYIDLIFLAQSDLANVSRENRSAINKIIRSVMHDC